ncbi:MAG: hypothetical protein K1Y36_21745 [Blastocatellia bacterium]|nr:hypothetical protein [Blastocatellia bacterium]
MGCEHYGRRQIGIILAYGQDEANTRFLLEGIEGKPLTAHYPETGKNWNEALLDAPTRNGYK